MKDRIEGWTQADEDSTFGLNGCRRGWTGDDPPCDFTPETLTRVLPAG